MMPASGVWSVPCGAGRAEHLLARYAFPLVSICAGSWRSVAAILRISIVFTDKTTGFVGDLPARGGPCQPFPTLGSENCKPFLTSSFINFLVDGELNSGSGATCTASEPQHTKHFE